MFNFSAAATQLQHRCARRMGKGLAGIGMAALAAVLTTGCGGGDDPANAALVAQVATTAGPIVGNAADSAGILSYKGIPYAAAPVGSLRWKEPQPVPSWSTARTTTQLGNRCWAAGIGGPIPTANTSEDCLTLNVWSGAKTRGAKLPVMVWLHGGGFQFGSSADAGYDGALLARKNVVVVTLNYRLGVFGYLDRPDLETESNGHSAGNYGLLDQIAALRWVKDNIAQFGGDAGNVTLFGESAGAHAVGFLMASPVASGLFHKAIGESGAFWDSEIRSKADAQLQSGAALATALSVPNTLADLRAVPALQLQTATDWNFAVRTKFSPHVDGYVATKNPYQVFKDGTQARIPLLLGWNFDESIPFIPFSLGGSPQTVTAAQFVAAATPVFGSARLAEFSAQYPSPTDAVARLSSSNELSDITIKYQMWEWARLQQQKAPVYLYHFNFASAFTPIPTHVTEVGYVFGNLVPTPFNHGSAAAEDVAMSEKVQTYWTNFARSGNPNGNGLTTWPAYSGPGGNALYLGSATTSPVPGVLPPTGITALPEEGTSRFQFLNSYRDPVTGVFTLPRQTVQ